MLKKVLGIIFSIIILIGVGGCMAKQSNNTEKNNSSVKDEMMKHMKDKYNEQFKFVNIGTEVWSAPYTEMKVGSDKFPGSVIVIRRNDKTGVTVDNYVDFLMKSKIEEAMNEISSKIYPKSKVLYEPGGAPLPDKITPEISVEEYSKFKDIGLSLTLCISDPNYKTSREQKIEQLRMALKNKGYRCNLIVFYVLDGKLDLINNANMNELFAGATEAKWSIIRGEFSMDRTYKFRYSEWRDLR
jgi:hypothetical protein